MTNSTKISQAKMIEPLIIQKFEYGTKKNIMKNVIVDNVDEVDIFSDEEEEEKEEEVIDYVSCPQIFVQTKEQFKSKSEDNLYCTFTSDMRTGLIYCIRNDSTLKEYFKNYLVEIEKGKKFTDEDKEKSKNLMKEITTLTNSGKMKIRFQRGKEYAIAGPYKKYYWNFKIVLAKK